MIEMFRNCSHYSHHSTYFERNGGGKIVRVRKVAFDGIGADELNREHQGLGWYAHQRKLDENKIVIESNICDQYGYLILKYFEGRQVRFPISPTLITQEFKTAYEHYINIFRADDFSISHGDYSLCNHIFSDNDDVCWLIDWEQFNEELPRGYDIIYCLVEPFLFWVNARKKCQPGAVKLAGRLLSKAQQEIGFNHEIISTPAAWLRDCARKNKQIFGCQLQKVPFVASPPENIASVDKLFRECK
ncbi:hypothetical protein ACFL0O_01635 [Thermodesulfobacteriota bacterium]